MCQKSYISFPKLWDFKRGYTGSHPIGHAQQSISEYICEAVGQAVKMMPSAKSKSRRRAPKRDARHEVSQASRGVGRPREQSSLRAGGLKN